MNHNKLKFFIVLLLIFILIMILFYSIFGISLSYKTLEEIKENRQQKDDLISELKINNVDTIYDKNANIYYYQIPESYENNMYVLKLNLESNFKYKLLDYETNVIKVEYNTPIKIIIYNQNYYYLTEIQLTNLSIINLLVDSEITEEDSNSKFTYINQAMLNKKVESNSKIHIRGASSSIFPKKSYRFEMNNKDYSKEKDIILPSFIQKSDFILDAVYREPSKIRNVLSTQLWNDISKDFSNIDIKSEFVELFINNEYKGLYVLTEPINRSNLKLNKSNSIDTSILIKMINWINIDSDESFENIASNEFDPFEIKYPKDENLFPSVWKTVFSNVSKYYDKDINITDEIINSTFELNNYIDIIIFNSFISNVDSCMRYNGYLYLENLKSKVYIQPWDMEYSYGFHGKTAYLKDLTYDKISCEFYHPYAEETNKKLIDRYWNLRKSILTEKYFDNLLDSYKEALTKGAASRDSNKWRNYDIEKEIEDVRSWIHNRIKFFDSYVEGLEYE